MKDIYPIGLHSIMSVLACQPSQHSSAKAASKFEMFGLKGTLQSYRISFLSQPDRHLEATPE